jgi:hypothetical protein
VAQVRSNGLDGGTRPSDCVVGEKCAYDGDMEELSIFVFVSFLLRKEKRSLECLVIADAFESFALFALKGEIARSEKVPLLQLEILSMSSISATSFAASRSKTKVERRSALSKVWPNRAHSSFSSLYDMISNLKTSATRSIGGRSLKFGDQPSWSSSFREIDQGALSKGGRFCGPLHTLSLKEIEMRCVRKSELSLNLGRSTIPH